MMTPDRMNNCWDVVVLGGGVSGCMAAMAAALQGSKTLLVEQYGFLGGSLTNSGVGPMMTFHAGKRQIVTGLPQELIDNMTLLGGCLGHLEDTTGYASSVTPFDSEVMKITLDSMMEEKGVEVLFHATLDDVQLSGDTIQSVIVQTKKGKLELNGKVFIDATGDAMLSFVSGAKCHTGRDSDGLCQPMTTNMKISGVNTETLRKEIKRNNSNFNIKNIDCLDRTPRVSMAGFYQEYNKAKELGEISSQREDVLLFETVNPGEVIVNTTRVIKLNPLDAWDLSKAEIQGRKQAFEIFTFLKNKCIGFAEAVLLSTGVQIGVRESRRVEGDYLLTADDLLNSIHFKDTIALGGYPIDIHNPEGAKTETVHLRPGQFYYIPLRSLFVKGKDNLVVCGRCISATHEAGAAIRVTPIAMAIGQAAGVAAGQAASSNKNIRELDPERIQYAIVKLGGTIE